MILAYSLIIIIIYNIWPKFVELLPHLHLYLIIEHMMISALCWLLPEKYSGQQKLTISAITRRPGYVFLQERGSREGTT